MGRRRKGAAEGYYANREAGGGPARVVLMPMPPDEAGTAVGTFDGRPLVFVGRMPTVGGVAVDRASLWPAVADALDVAASKAFGNEWITSLARVAGVSTRTLARDRVVRFGVHPDVLVRAGVLATSDNPRALGQFSLAEWALREAGITDPVVLRETLTDCYASAAELMRCVHAARSARGRVGGGPRGREARPGKAAAAEGRVRGGMR